MGSGAWSGSVDLRGMCGRMELSLSPREGEPGGEVCYQRRCRGRAAEGRGGRGTIGDAMTKQTIKVRSCTNAHGGRA